MTPTTDSHGIELQPGDWCWTVTGHGIYSHTNEHGQHVIDMTGNGKLVAFHPNNVANHDKRLVRVGNAGN